MSKKGGYLIIDLKNYDLLTIVEDESYYNFVMQGTLINSDDARFYVKLVYLG